MKPHYWYARLLTAAALSTSLTTLAAAQDSATAPAAEQAPAQAAPAERPDPSAGSIRVLVLDQTGAAIVGATVSAVLANAPSGTAARTATANEQGEALFANLPPGKYVLQVESVGFETQQVADVT